MNPILRSLTTSFATELKQSTWIILGERFSKSSFRQMNDFMDACLRSKGFNVDEWMKTGEMPSEMICRFAKQKRLSVDQFLLKYVR
jgi:histidinol phosphatase-like enzyme